MPVRLSLRLLTAVTAVTALAFATAPSAPAASATGRPGIAVGPQYDSTHVYVAPGTMDSFISSWESTFGGTNTTQVLADVTPTPSLTKSELVLSPVGTLSVFDYQTPVPYPFGVERTGWLVTDLDRGVHKAEADGAVTVVTPFADPIGRDAIVQFPGGIDAQLYWHTKAPSYPALASVPENRLYLPSGAAASFLHSYLAFTGGTVVSDDRHAPGAELGLPGTTYRRIRISSPFGDTSVAVTDGHLPYPFGRESTGYAVNDLTATLAKARSAGATVLWGPSASAGRDSAMVQFPGGYIAEIHDAGPRS
ncbi:glyoxalase [Kitasatospora sp. NBC_01250]|uniref:glyoxalase n=1 Tax=unclassified Kitasatospora TaxID=2633591 RepID=UPI002E158694|nr:MULTISPECIES: glyoxalase [unclassified Kitasatospora]WSJ71056.1 glyoxalase [Kitasatospora sp. NBC_01302]